MDMQKPSPRGRSSSINPGPGAAVECKNLGAAVECKNPGGRPRGGCWGLELTDTLIYHHIFVETNGTLPAMISETSYDIPDILDNVQGI